MTAELIKEEADGRFRVCVNKDKKTLSCQCFSPFREVERSSYALAEYMAHFINRPHRERQQELWLMLRIQGRRNAVDAASTDEGSSSRKGNHRHYQFPFYATAGDDEVVTRLQDHYVCKSALQHILNLGRKRWDHIHAAMVRGLPPPAHPLLGKESNRRKALKDDQIYDDFRVYFEGVQELGEPRVTRFIREATGVGLRESDVTPEEARQFKDSQAKRDKDKREAKAHKKKRKDPP